MTILPIILLFTVLLALPGAAQPRIDLVLNSGQGWPRMTLVGVERDSVMLFDSSGSVAFHVNDVLEFQHRKGSYMSEVGGAGLLAGFVGGVAWHLGEGGSLWDMFDTEDDPYDDNDGANWRVWAPAIGGAIVGAGIGALIPKTQVVTFTGLGVEMRVAEFRRLLTR